MQQSRWGRHRIPLCARDQHSDSLSEPPSRQSRGAVSSPLVSGRVGFGTQISRASWTRPTSPRQRTSTVRVMSTPSRPTTSTVTSSTTRPTGAVGSSTGQRSGPARRPTRSASLTLIRTVPWTSLCLGHRGDPGGAPPAAGDEVDVLLHDTLAVAVPRWTRHHRDAVVLGDRRRSTCSCSARSGPAG